MTEIPARLSIVTLGARDMRVLRSFYRALGWPELPSGDDTWTGFLLGGVLLALFPLPDLTAEAAPGIHGPTGWSGVTLACTVSTQKRSTPRSLRPWRPARLQSPTQPTGPGAGAPRSSPTPRATAGRSPGHHGPPSTRAAP